MGHDAKCVVFAALLPPATSFSPGESRTVSGFRSVRMHALHSRCRNSSPSNTSRAICFTASTIIASCDQLQRSEADHFNHEHNVTGKQRRPPTTGQGHCQLARRHAATLHQTTNKSFTGACTAQPHRCVHLAICHLQQQQRQATDNSPLLIPSKYSSDDFAMTSPTTLVHALDLKQSDGRTHLPVVAAVLPLHLSFS